MDAHKEDLAASQADAKRQLERLEQALKGEKPADEKAAELAKQQKDLAAQAAKTADDPKATPEQKQALKQAEQQIARTGGEAQAGRPPRRPQAQGPSAAQAADQAAKAAEANPTSPEAQKQMQEAAKKLDELAKQLNGQESEAARAQRLAERQAEAAAEAQHQAQEQPNAKPNPATQQKEQQVAEEASSSSTPSAEGARAEKQKATRTPCKSGGGRAAGTGQGPARGGRRPARPGRQAGRPRQRRDAAKASGVGLEGAA